jgi:ribosomal protein S18 acetylase RimI-like enzyme
VEVTVRGLGANDWQLLRDVRLSALAESPDAFLMTWREASEWTEARWRATAPRRAIALADESPIGMVGWHVTGRHCELVGLWVDPEHRGGPAATALVRHVVAANTLPVELEVKLSNPRAVAFYTRIGFADSPTPPTRANHRRLRYLPPL